jgi:hypothetical protein
VAGARERARPPLWLVQQSLREQDLESISDTDLLLEEAPPPGRSLWDRLFRKGERSAPLPPERYNERVLYIEMLFQSISGAGALSFVAVFLVRLGAPNWLVGLHTSLPALVTILAVLPMGAFVRRQRSLVRVVNVARLIYRSVVACFAFLVYLPTTVAPFILVAAESLLAIPGAALNVASTTILGRATTPRRRPAMLSTRMAVHGLMASGVGLLAGLWLDAVVYPLNYQLLFASALLAGLGSVYMLSRLKLPPISAEQIAGRARVGIREMLALIRATPGFRDFAIAAFVFRMGQNLPMALYSIYRVRTLGASDAWIGILLTIQRFLSVFGYIVLSRLLARAKSRSWLWVSCLGVALYPVAMAMARTPQQLVIASVIAGIFSPGVDVFMTNTLFQVSTEEERPTFVAANTLLANVTGFTAPLLGTLLADLTFIRLALLAATALRLIGAVVFWRLKVGQEQPAPSAAQPDAPPA